MVRTLPRGVCRDLAIKVTGRGVRGKAPCSLFAFSIRGKEDLHEQ